MTAPPEKPTVPGVLPLVRFLYRHPGGEAGCCLHIMLEDGNVDDHSAAFSVEIARSKKHPTCLQLAKLLQRMSPTQRKKLYRAPK